VRFAFGFRFGVISERGIGGVLSSFESTASNWSFGTITFTVSRLALVEDFSIFFIGQISDSHKVF